MSNANSHLSFEIVAVACLDEEWMLIQPVVREKWGITSDANSFTDSK